MPAVKNSIQKGPPAQKPAKASAHATAQDRTKPVRGHTAAATGQGGRAGQYQGMTAIEPTRITVGANTDEKVMTESANPAKTQLLLEVYKSEAASPPAGRNAKYEKGNP